MNPARYCTECGAEIGDDTPGGQCARCLMNLALEQSEAGIEPSTAESHSSEQIGALIGRYKLLERLGEGGFGAVWAAEQREPVRRRVALKVIKPGMDSRQVVARFEAERQALALMDHPHIAKVLDAGTTDTGRPYFVMELVRGIPITQYCERERLPTGRRLELFILVCQAVQHAHQKGIIHRDIKPSNILVTLHDGVPVPKVIDFGIAKATQAELTEKTIYTQFHQFIGTPAYMSPEQAELSGLDIDTRSDIYSLGVLLYELLTGTTPFHTKELLQSGLDEMRRIIREVEPIRPSTRLTQLEHTGKSQIANRKSKIENDLDWIVMKCLEKDRARRYETANGLAADLRRHLNNEPVVARPPSSLYRLQKTFRRNKLAFVSSAAVAAALVLGLAASLWQASVATQQRNAADAARQAEARERKVAQAERNKALEAQKTAEEEGRRTEEERVRAEFSERQSRRLLYVSDMNLAQQALQHNNVGRARQLLERHRPLHGEADLRGWEWRYLWQLSSSSAIATLTRGPIRGLSVAFSPDGSRLAIGWQDGRVELWDVESRRRVRTLLDGESRGPARVAFAPADERLLLFIIR
jgi:eukaryotic-like serine/threonine-protein kinase